MNDYIDGELPAIAAGAVAQHLSLCARCRAELASLRAIRDGAAALPREIAPARDLWAGIEAAVTSVDGGREEIPPGVERRVPAAPIREEKTHEFAVTGRAGPPFMSRSPSRRTPARWFIPLAVAAALAMLATVADRRAARHAVRPAWAVAATAGTPRVNSAPIAGAGQIRPGQWLVTDGTSRAKVTVGSIGEVTLEPNSRLRLAQASATDHRLELARGELSAFIWAPPRLFFVDTPSATAVDLGCAYTLRVDDAGGSELRVSSGHVALEHRGRESIIPAGWMCLTRPGVGPGTPFLSEAPVAWRQLVEEFDFGPGRRAAVFARLLASARPEDGITLWHLLARTDAGERGAVFDALAQHHAPPAGVTRAGIIAGDRAMRMAWAAELGLSTYVTN